jgi:hypothetical protein
MAEQSSEEAVPAYLVLVHLGSLERSPGALAFAQRRER